MVTFTLDMLNCVSLRLRHLGVVCKGNALPSLSISFCATAWSKLRRTEQVTATGSYIQFDNLQQERCAIVRCPVTIANTFMKQSCNLQHK